MKNKLIFLLLGLVLATSFTVQGVNALEFDNVKNIKEDGIAGYPNIKIKNMFGLGSILWEGELTKNTDTCGESCSAEKTITIYDTGSLIDDVRFETITETGRVEQRIRSYKFYIKTGEEEIEVDDYEWVCVETGKVSGNGTKEQTCSNVKVGSHIEYNPIWKEYSLKQELEAGTYEVKLEGQKEPSRAVDWIIKSEGIWIDDWAVWGANDLLNKLVGYWDFETNTELVSGVMNLTPDDGQVTFQTSSLNGKAGLFDAAHNMLFDNTASGTNWEFPVNTTLSFWINYTSGYTCINKRNAGTGWFGAGGFGTLSGFGGSLDSSVTANIWEHVVLMRNDTHVSVWRNGLIKDYEVSSVATQSVEVALGNGARIGEADGQGEFDEFALWNKTLTSSEVSELYNSGDGLFYSDFGTSQVTLNSPANNSVSPTNNVQFNCSADTTDGATLTNMSLWHNGTGTWNRNQTQTKTGTTNESIFTSSFNDGNYLWTCEACDSDDDCGFASENRTITIDTTNPLLNATSPSGDQGIFFSGKSLVLNWTVSDTNLESCWYDYDFTNTTVVCGSNPDSFIVTSEDNTNLTFYANDSAGNLNSSFTSWFYSINENSQSFQSSTFDTSRESFNINITFDSDRYTDVSGTLVYNNSRVSGTESGSGGELVFTAEKDIAVVSSETNNTFYWEVAMTDVSGQTLFNSTFNNQTVNPSTFIQCGAGELAVNYTTYQESNQTLLNTDFDATFEWKLNDSSSVTKNSSFSLSGSSQYNFCTNNNKTYFTDVDIKLDADGYTERTFGFIDEEFSNDTTHQRLYLLNDTLGTDFIITLKDVGLFPLPGHTIKIFRKLESGGEILVENEVTDHIGQIVARVIENDARYRILFYDEDNNLVKTISDALFVCTTTICQQTFIVQDLTDAFDDFDDLTDYTSSLTYDNNTRTFTFVWVDNRGESQTHRLLVEKITFANGTETLQNTTSTSNSGVLSYTATDDTASYRVSAFRSVGGDENRIGVLNVKIGDSADIFSFEGLYWSFILFMLLLLVGRFHPPTGIILYLFGVFMLGIFGLIYTNPAIIIAQFVIGVIFIWAWKG